jgi:hypothetical protein
VAAVAAQKQQQDQQRKQQILKQQRWLLFLRHCAKCNAGGVSTQTLLWPHGVWGKCAATPWPATAYVLRLFGAVRLALCGTQLKSALSRHIEPLCVALLPCVV